MGIGFFTILGVEKSFEMGVRPEIAEMMGVFAAVMGGYTRYLNQPHTNHF